MNDTTREFSKEEVLEIRKRCAIPADDPRARLVLVQAEVVFYQRLGLIALGAWFTTALAAIAVILCYG